MKTANGILALIQEYGSECNDSYYSKSTAARLKILRTAIEELHRDAARYRWLRDSEVNQEDQSWIAVGEFDSFGVSAIARNDLDEAIDAAMQEST